MKPILFSTPMVQAILAGNKRQTRRIIKPQPEFSFGYLIWFSKRISFNFHATDNKFSKSALTCASYQLGDILYVRETWCNIIKPEYPPEYYYLADCLQPWVEDYDASEWKWRPSIHMPKEAARIFLRVTDVRAERLQDINDADAHAEGMDSPSYPLIQYKDFWNELNAKRGYDWDSNPWVWVYTFEKIGKEDINK